MSLSARGQRRFHLAFVTLVFILGFSALADALLHLDMARDWTITVQWIGLAVLVFASGRFAVKVPGMEASLSISEVFLFSMVMMYGSAPAVITVAVDGLAVSLIRRHHHPKHIAFNLAEPALSMWVASKLYYALAGVSPLWVAPPSVGILQVGLPALVLCGVYFLMNSWLNAIAMTSESGASPIGVWRKYFLWVSLNYFGGASIAVLLSVNARSAGFGVLLPIAPLVIISYYMFKSSIGRLEDENVHLAEVNRLYLKVVEALAMAVDAKDQVTHGHICRVQTYALRLTKTLNVTDPKEVQAIEAAALLHDMGKLAIPEHILNKPGKLTIAEFERMKQHAPLGAEMLSSVDFPYPVVPIVRHHHENWDGTGYPAGISGNAIPIGARILSVVDCYDALRSHRPYRRALSPAQAMEIVTERRGTMYDPAVVDAFVAVQDSIEAESVEEPLPAVLDQFSQAARESHPTMALEPSTVPLELRLFATNGLLRLYEQISTLGPDASLADTCDVVVRYLRRMAPAGLVVFYRKDGIKDELAVQHASGFGEALLPDHRIQVGHGITGWVVANHRSVLNADPALDVGSRLDELSPRFRSTLSIPLSPELETTGAVTLYSDQPNAFTDDQRLAIELISGAVAEAIEQAYRRKLAMDKGGGVPTEVHAISGAMEAILDRNVFWRSSTGRNLGVVCVQALDDDRAMDHAAVAVSQATRIADLIFRPTDHELIVLMPDCEPAAGQMIADRIGAALPQAVVAGPDGPAQLRMAFACGPYDGDTVRQLLAVARRRMVEPELPVRHSDSAIEMSVSRIEGGRE